MEIRVEQRENVVILQCPSVGDAVELLRGVLRSEDRWVSLREGAEVLQVSPFNLHYRLKQAYKGMDKSLVYGKQYRKVKDRFWQVNLKYSADFACMRRAN